MNDKRTPFQQLDPAAKDNIANAMTARRRECEHRLSQLPEIRMEGEAALRRLLPVAQSDTGQSSVIARFLLSLYNGDRFPFDLTDFRRLDYALFDDCMAVLKMDSQPPKEVHRFFENGSAIWESLAKDWSFKDFAKDSWR